MRGEKTSRRGRGGGEYKMTPEIKNFEAVEWADSSSHTLPKYTSAE